VHNVSGCAILGRTATRKAPLSVENPGLLSAELTSLPVEISVDSEQVEMQVTQRMICFTIINCFLDALNFPPFN
jgi:hypothetical protein